MNNIPSPAINPITNMKLPLANSVPSLMDIDPFSQFEFHFLADEPWWDEFDTSDYNSDFSSVYDSIFMTFLQRNVDVKQK